jgi:hypothetical protein
MFTQAESPLVQVTQQPSLVISILQEPIIMLQLQTTIPFIMQQTLHIPPAIMVQRFCIMVQAAGSSQLQVIFMPPAHFSTFIAQRGTITMLGDIAGIPLVIGMPPERFAIALRSIIIAVVMIKLHRGQLEIEAKSAPRSFFALKADPKDRKGQQFRRSAVDLSSFLG